VERQLLTYRFILCNLTLFKASKLTYPNSIQYSDAQWRSKEGIHPWVQAVGAHQHKLQKIKILIVKQKFRPQYA